MRSLSLFFRFLVGGLIAVAAAFLLGREMLLLYTSVGLNNQMNELNTLVKNPAMYNESCRTKFQNYGDSEMLSGFQIRFVDDTRYMVEAVCLDHEQEPILIKQGQLTSFVKKVPGYSGMFFSAAGQPTAVGIEALGRARVVSSKDAPRLEVGSPELAAPATSCTGFGFSCCDPELQIPDGATAGNKALDCPGRCFRACKSKPVVLSFRSDPPLDGPTRIVTLPRDAAGKAELTLTYVASDPDGSIQSVVIDYGDGQKATSTEIEGRIAHTYTCTRSGGCQFTATITITDNEGNTSPQGESSLIIVKM